MTGATSGVEIELVKADQGSGAVSSTSRTHSDPSRLNDAHSTCRASEMELTEGGMRNCPNVTPITILPVDYVKLFCGWSTPPCSGARRWNLGPSSTTLGTGVSAQKKLVVARIK